MNPGAAVRRLRARTAPDAPLVVFLHGLEDDWRSWSAIADRLGPHWDTVALDLPWRAGNDYRWRWAADPATWVSDGLALLDRPAEMVVGHSFGANATLAALCRGSADVGRLVMLMPHYRPAERLPDWTTWDRSREALTLQMRAAVQLRLGGRRRRVGEELTEAMTGKVLDRIGLSGFLSVFEQYVRSGHLPVDRVSRPVLVVSGGRDPGVSRDDLDRLATSLPAGRLAWREDFDHFSHVGRAGEVAELLGEFTATAGAARREGSDRP